MESQQALLSEAHKDYYTADPFKHARLHLDDAHKLRTTLDVVEQEQTRTTDDWYTLKLTPD